MTSSENKGSIVRALSLLTRRERRRLGVLMVLVIIGIGLETLGIGLVIPAIVLITQDNLGERYPTIQPVLDVLGNPPQTTLIFGGMAILVGIYLVKSLYLAMLALVQNRFLFGVRIRMSEQLYANYLGQPWTFHLQRNSATLIRNILTETQQLVQNVLSPALILVTEGLLLTCLIVILLLVEPVGASVVGLILGLACLVFYGMLRNRVTNWGAVRHHHDALRIQQVQQGLNGAKDVKLLGREQEFLASFRIHNGASTRMLRYQATLNQMPRLWLEFLAILALAMLVVTMLTQGREMSAILPTLGLFAAVAFRIMPSINKILSAMQSLRFGHVAARNLHGELLLPMLPPARSQDEPPLAFEQEIRLDHIDFSYPDTAELTLEDISIRVHKGESVGIIGPSGSGKSTLVDLVLGILTPDRGSVCVDGVDIRTTIRGWQNQLGYVAQTIYLTDDTFRRNIAFGIADRDIDDDAIDRAVVAAQLNDFIASLPDGLDTILGERGVRLSGGQRQRIGIARALYHDPEVLVLDEATSALDSTTEQEVMSAVAALHGTKTILVVAHRLTTVADCDRIYRLDEGKVVDQGLAIEVLSRQKTLTGDLDELPADKLEDGLSRHRAHAVRSLN